MFNVTITVSVLNIVVCAAIIVGCIYAMYRIIKKCKSTKTIKNSQGEVVGFKKTGSKVKTIILIFILFTIIIFADIIGVSHIFNIIFIS